MEDFVNLKVGGCLYQTSLTTLTNRPDTMLANMFSWRIPSRQDQDGNYLIDRDGPIFRHILNFLRSSRLCLPENFSEWDLLKVESDYYQVGDLVTAADLLYKERCERKKRRETEEKEFIEIATKRTMFGYRLITSYIGPFKIFKEIEPLWSYFQQFSYEDYEGYTTEKAIEAILDNTDQREINDDRMSSEKPFFKKFDLFATYQSVTQYGFSLISTMALESTEEHTEIQKYVFERTVQK